MTIRSRPSHSVLALLLVLVVLVPIAVTHLQSCESAKPRPPFEPPPKPVVGACIWIDVSGTDHCHDFTAEQCNEVNGSWFPGQKCPPTQNLTAEEYEAALIPIEADTEPEE